MRKSQIRLFLVDYGLILAQYLAAAFIAVGVLTFKLVELLPGISARELTALNNSQSLSTIRSNPIEMPYKVLLWVSQKISPNNILSARLISIIIGLSILVVFFFIVRYWFGFWVGILSTLMLLTSSWFLGLSRQATPDILQLYTVALIGYGLWLRSEKYQHVALIVGVVLAGLSVYIPGLIWLVIFGAIHQRKHIQTNVSDARWITPVGLLLLVVLIVPLAWGIINDQQLLRTSLGLPSTFKDLVSVPRNIAVIPYRLLWSGPPDGSFWLTRTPLLDYMTATFAILGLFSFFDNRKLDRSKITISSLVFTTLLVGFTSSMTLGYILPIVYLLAAAGLAFMIHQWLIVFPKNPFARSLMVILIALAVISVGYYQLRHYFLAWPRNPITRQYFNPY